MVFNIVVFVLARSGLSLFGDAELEGQPRVLDARPSRRPRTPVVPRILLLKEKNKTPQCLNLHTKEWQSPISRRWARSAQRWLWNFRPGQMWAAETTRNPGR
jgi:hypothetical protein